jgi:hypothetical protein
MTKPLKNLWLFRKKLFRISSYSDILYNIIRALLLLRALLRSLSTTLQLVSVITVTSKNNIYIQHKLKSQCCFVIKHFSSLAIAAGGLQSANATISEPMDNAGTSRPRMLSVVTALDGFTLVFKGWGTSLQIMRPQR